MRGASSCRADLGAGPLGHTVIGAPLCAQAAWVGWEGSPVGVGRRSDKGIWGGGVGRVGRKELLTCCVTSGMWPTLSEPLFPAE